MWLQNDHDAFINNHFLHGFHPVYENGGMPFTPKPDTYDRNKAYN